MSREQGIHRGLGVAAVIATTVAVAAIASTVLVTLRVARTVITPVRRAKQDQSLVTIDAAAREVTLYDTPDGGVPGRYGVWFSGDTGYLRVGDVVRRGARTVTRSVDDVVFGDLGKARRGRMGGWYYLEPEELGYPVRSVEITTSLGTAPAWLIPARDDDGSGAGSDSGSWVIQVHGRGARRHEGLRAVPVFREHGYTSLLLSYRNDGDAPESEDRRYGLGGTEWLDVESGIRFALDHGATSIVLMGWSMGGAIVLQTAMRSPSMDRVRGIVLESPVVDWIDTLEFQARLYRLPSPVASGAIRILGSRWSTALTGQSAAIDLKSMDFVSRASELSLPTLILHSDDDGFVPATGSRALAVSRPDIVTFVPFSQARHTKLWNYDEERWNSSIADWLEKLEGAAD